MGSLCRRETPDGEVALEGIMEPLVRDFDEVPSS
jgi:hypothetical protein